MLSTAYKTVVKDRGPDAGDGFDLAAGQVKRILRYGFNDYVTDDKAFFDNVRKLHVRNLNEQYGLETGLKTLRELLKSNGKSEIEVALSMYSDETFRIGSHFLRV